MNNVRSPKVTVLMPVYNGEKYLSEAIDSILKQSYTDFELLIINDGSTDSTVDIIRSYDDHRIRLIHNDSNMELIFSLNKGIELANGKYIARMDCDDVNLPDRLKQQVGFMDSNPAVCICGTWVQTIGSPSGDIWKYPIDDATIRSRFIFESVIAHPSVIMRKEFLLRYGLRYNISHKHAEDYDLWVRSSQHGALANINDVLILRRIHPFGIGQKHAEEQQAVAKRIRLRQLQSLGLQPSQEEIDLHQSISLWRFEAKRHFIKHLRKWLIKLKSANNETLIYPEMAFLKVLAERWYASCVAAKSLGIWTWIQFMRSTLSQTAGLHILDKIMFGLECLRKQT